MRFSFWAVIGVISSWAVIIIGILLGQVGILPYVSFSSLFITLGGSFTTMIIATPAGFFGKMFTYFRIALSNRDLRSATLININMLVNLSDRARKDGLLALEDNLQEIDNVYMRKGIQMVIDGTDPGIIKRTLLIEQDEVRSRHEQVQGAFGYAEKVLPAFGLVGTIIGLIALLGNIGGDPTAIGLGMQTALITTLYGVLLANMVFAPVRNKLEELDTEEFRLYNIVLEGVLGIQSGDNPRILKDRLLSFLSNDAKERMLIEEE